MNLKLFLFVSGFRFGVSGFKLATLNLKPETKT